MADITFDILKAYGTISADKGGWTKEMNFVSWNGRNPKLDIRDWSPDHSKMGKGVTFTREEAETLAEMLKTALDEPGGWA
jgi:hypothetical protein